MPYFSACSVFISRGQGAEIVTYSPVSAPYFDQTFNLFGITHLALHVLPPSTLTLEPLTENSWAPYWKLSETPLIKQHVSILFLFFLE